MFDKYKHIVSHIALGSGVIDTVAGWICNAEYKKVLVVSDPNTYRVAGKRVISSLRDADVTVSEFCFPDDEPLPDELSVGLLLAAFTLDVDLILGVGSGTINDICTYVGSQVGCPSAIVGTAPSMDGYSSLGSSMLLGGVKVTPPTQCPVAIFCDTDILVQAPMHMIAAGLGDMLGKITSLADWRLSHLMTGEPIPPDIYNLMESALSKVLESVEGAAKREPKAIECITEGLILSGIAMSLYGDSRPASGTEHHLAHFFELRTRKHELHGTKVALGTVMALVIWKALLRNALKEHDAFFCNDNSSGVVNNRAQDERFNKTLSDRAQDILDIANSLPEPDEVINMLASVGMIVSPKALGLSSHDIHEGVLYAKDRKPTYTLLQHLSRLNLLDEYAGIVNDYFAKRALQCVKCFVLDMDGTIYLGDRLFSFTHDFLAHLKKLGKDYVFFTNNSSQNAAHYINKLKRMGIEMPDEKLLMSTHVLLDWLGSGDGTFCDSGCDSGDGTFCDSGDGTFCHQALGDKTYRPHCHKTYRPHCHKTYRPHCHPHRHHVFVAGTQALKDDFTAAGYTLTDDNPDFCVLGFDTDMNYERLNLLCDFVRSGVPVYGVNMDYNCPVERTIAQTGFIPDCGSLGAAVTASTGVDIEFFGKPSRRALDYIIKQTGYNEEELCFIGDRLYTDIAITNDSKARSVLVLSGETKRDDLNNSPHVPDLVADDLEQLQLYYMT